MGTWGTGNFDNDTAGDYFLGIIKKIVEDIRTKIDLSADVEANIGWEDKIPCALEIITVLGQQDFHCLCLEPEEIRKWKQIFMERWGVYVKDTWFEEDDKAERERILNETFDKLISLSENE